ncbi:MAG TPA: hypothetical protein VFI08_02510 [Spirochaetia bacterium]|nr:hypothetical protein [Spirochaetia bacterium]
MAKAKTVTLLSFTLPNKIGQLASVAELLAAAEVNILALRAAEVGANAECTLGVKNAKKALKALMPLSVEVKQTEALCIELPNKAGRLQKVAGKLAAAGVNVQSAWSTAFTGKTASCILQTADDKKALATLKK